MKVLNLSVILRRSRYVDINEVFQQSAAKPNQADGFGSAAAGKFDGPEDIGGITRSGDRHHEISMLQQIFQLLLEHHVVVGIVRPCAESPDWSFGWRNESRDTHRRCGCS